MELARLRAEDAPAIDRAAPRVIKRTLRLKYYAALFVSDTLAVLIGTIAASLLRFGSLSQEHVQVLAVIMLPMLWVFQLSSSVPAVLVDWRRGIAPALTSLLASATVALTVAFFLHYGPEISRLMIIASVGLSAILMIAGRIAIGEMGRRDFGGDAVQRALIVDQVAITAPPGVDRIDAAAIGLTNDAHHPLALDRLARALDGADIVYVACVPERRVAWSSALQGSNHHVEVLVPELKAMGVLGSRQFAGLPTIVIGPGRMRGRDVMLKRAFDLALVVPMLMFLAPLLALVALAIKLDSRGPVLFIQKRVGLGNRLFDTYKFRSMYTDLCDRDGNVSASRLDNRVTRVGRFIRATSIDELAQLFNILRGDMSFVGPRPHAMGSLAGDALFWEVDNRYHDRHACKPGLTGLAQVRGFRGATHRREDLINRLRADLEYLNGWSLARDIAILFATVKVVVWRDPELVDPVAPADDVACPLAASSARLVGAVTMSLVDRAGAARLVLEAVRTHAVRTFAFCNATAFGLARRSPEFAAALNSATVFAENAPIRLPQSLDGAARAVRYSSDDVAASVLAGLPRRTRVFVAGDARSLDTALLRLGARYPWLTFVGRHHSPIDDRDGELMADQVRESGADLLLLAIGAPDQEIWAHRFGAFTGAVVLCVRSLDVGASPARSPTWARPGHLRRLSEHFSFARAVARAGRGSGSGPDDRAAVTTD